MFSLTLHIQELKRNNKTYEGLKYLVYDIIERALSGNNKTYEGLKYDRPVGV